MTRRFRVGILIVLVVFLSYLAYLVLVPFFAPLTWAAVFAIVFYPVHLFILRYLKRPSLAALSSVALVLIIILGPLSYLSYFLVGELQDLSNAGLTMEGMRSVYRDSFVNGLMERVLPVFHLEERQAMAYVANGVSNLSRQLLHWVPSGLGSVASGLANFLIMAFILFFLFKDGSVYVTKILEYLPFSERNKEHLSGQVRDVIASTIYGGVAVALVQGIIGSDRLRRGGHTFPCAVGPGNGHHVFPPLYRVPYRVGAHVPLSSRHRTHSEGDYSGGLWHIRHRPRG